MVASATQEGQCRASSPFGLQGSAGDTVSWVVQATSRLVARSGDRGGASGIRPTRRRGRITVTERKNDADVIIIGGGPAGSALGTLPRARRTLKDHHREGHPPARPRGGVAHPFDQPDLQGARLPRQDERRRVHPQAGDRLERAAVAAVEVRRDLAVRVPDPQRAPALHVQRRAGRAWTPCSCAMPTTTARRSCRA